MDGNPDAVRLARGVGSATVPLSPVLRHDTGAVWFLVAGPSRRRGSFRLDDHGTSSGTLTFPSDHARSALSAAAPEGLTGQSARVSVPAGTHWAVYLTTSD